MNENNLKKITLGIIALCIAILSGFGFYKSNKDKPAEEIINNALNEVKEYISTYEMTDEEIKELPSTEIVEQNEAEEKEVGETQATTETERI